MIWLERLVGKLGNRLTRKPDGIADKDVFHLAQDKYVAGDYQVEHRAAKCLWSEIIVGLLRIRGLAENAQIEICNIDSSLNSRVWSACNAKRNTAGFLFHFAFPNSAGGANSEFADVVVRPSLNAPFGSMLRAGKLP